MKEPATYSRKLVFFAACVGMAFFGISLITLGSILPTLSGRLTHGNTAGLVTFLPVGVLSGSLIFGPFVDRFGYKYLLIFSSFLTACGLAGMALSATPGFLKIAIFITGAGGGILNGETNTLVADISDKNKNAGLSLLGIFFGIGALGIPTLLSFLSKIFPVESILEGTSLFILLLALSFFFIRFPLPKQPLGFPVKEGFRLLTQPVLLLLSLILFFESGLEGLANNWSTTFLQNSSMFSPDTALLALSGMVAGMTLTRLILGTVLRSAGTMNILIAGGIIIFLALTLIILKPLSDLVGIVLLGVGFAPVFPVILGYIGSLYSSLSGTAFSVALFIALTGNTFLNYLMGRFSEKAGTGIFPFIMLGAFVLMFTLIGITLSKNKILTKI